MRELADDVKEEITSIEGVFNPEYGTALGAPQLHVDINEVQAAANGLTTESINPRLICTFWDRLLPNITKMEMKLMS